MQKIFSKPNQITAFRVLLIPLFVYILLSNIKFKEYISAIMFIILSLSDALDGYVARKRKEITKIGKLIDPIADKLLISVALISLIGKGIEAWMAIVIISRETIITGLRLIFLSKGTVVSASILGKLKTISQTSGILFVILNMPYSWYLMLIAVILTCISGLDYLIRFSGMLKDKIINIPNFITFLRLILVPVFSITIIEGKTNTALIVLAVIALSDKVDGLSARIMKQITEFGSTFDSFTDWFFVILSLITFIYSKYISWLYGLLLVIPIFGAAIIKLYHLRRHNEILTSIISKIAVGFGYITTLAMIINFAYKHYFLIFGLGLTYLTMINFMIKSMNNKKLY